MCHGCRTARACFSDHFSIHVQLSIPTSKSCPLTKTVFSYPRADQNALLLHLSRFMHTFLDGFQYRSFDENWTLVRSALMEALHTFVPRVHIRSCTEHPWFSVSLKRLLSKKQRLYSRAKLIRTPSAWSKYRECALRCKYEIKKAKHKFFNIDLFNLHNCL